LVEEADGRMFPSTNQSQTIIDCLMREVNRLQIEISYHAGVQSIQKNTCFQLGLQNGEQLSADYVCLAVGGYPSLQQFDWLQSLGHTIVPPVPSLFTFNLPKHPITSLMGVSVPNVLVKVHGTNIKQEGPILITHWGLSGPAVLKASAWGATELAALKYEFKATINWIHAFNYNEQDIRTQWSEQRAKYSTQKIAAKSMFNLPIRLWQFLVASAGIQEHQNWSTLQSEQQKLLTKFLLAYEVQVSGKTTFKEEFVTAGGISLSEVDVNTMQSKKIEGLYFAGEILNVDGVTGGFNFQHAWTSGWIAAKSIAHSVNEVSVQS
jgi:predicted Rossmann fold flavoprotein